MRRAEHSGGRGRPEARRADPAARPLEGTGLTGEFVRDILLKAFERPADFPSLVSERVARNRRLSSDLRREYTEILWEAVRWRGRIWGEVAPSRLELKELRAQIEAARKVRAQPPLSRWVTASADSLAREISFPRWILERWLAQFGFPAAVQLALALNAPAPVTLRANTLRIERNELLRRLSREGVRARAGKLTPWAIRLEGRPNLRGSRAFKEGLFEIQDEGSQYAVAALEARPGELVVDACAGAGGKSLAIAAALENRGDVIAVDCDARPFAELSRRAKRAGATVVRAVWAAADDPNPLPSFEGKADRVIVDVPCSALGTLRRHPWSKWSLSPALIEDLPGKQLKLLKRYARYVRPGGRLAYVTCTIDRRENEIVVARFRAERPEFTLAGEPRQLRPDLEGSDGFFVALLARRNPPSPRRSSA